MLAAPRPGRGARSGPHAACAAALVLQILASSSPAGPPVRAGGGPVHVAAAQHASVPPATLQSGTLAFDARATTGEFTGSTSRVTGAVLGSADYAGLRGWVEAPAASMQTGNGLRDRDMRKSMEVERYPVMRFDLLGATPQGAPRPDGADLLLHGTLTLHGVSRAVDVPVTVARTADGAHVVGAVPVDVSDYGVRGLRKMMGMLKMDERITVRLDLRFAVQR